jgi:hypothetical protein
MGGHAARHYWEEVGLIRLMAGLLLPPAAWFVDLQFSYAIVKWACRADNTSPLLVMPLASLALTLYGGWLAWSAFQQLRASADEGGASMEDRSYFLAIAGLTSSAIFGLLILSSLIPRLVLSPCE